MLSGRVMSAPRAVLAMTFATRSCVGLPHEWSVDEYGRLLEIGGAAALCRQCTRHGWNLRSTLFPGMSRLHGIISAARIR